MDIFVFIGKGGCCGVTKEASGASLPAIGGWHFLKKSSLSREGGINAKIALTDMASKGYHLVEPDRISGPVGGRPKARSAPPM
jgi:hypothetical protein